MSRICQGFWGIFCQKNCPFLLTLLGGDPGLYRPLFQVARRSTSCVGPGRSSCHITRPAASRFKPCRASYHVARQALARVMSRRVSPGPLTRRHTHAHMHTRMRLQACPCTSSPAVACLPPLASSPVFTCLPARRGQCVWLKGGGGSKRWNGDARLVPFIE